MGGDSTTRPRLRLDLPGPRALPFAAVSTLSRHYLSTVAANGAILLLGVLSGVLAARLLGPETRGELTVIILWPSAVVYILGSLGLHDATTYFAARHPERLNAVFTVLQALGLAQTVVFGALAYF